MSKHKTAPVPDTKREALLGRYTTFWIAPLFVTECKWEHVRLSLRLTAVNLFDGIKVGLTKAHNVIVAVVRFSSKIRELDHHCTRLFLSSLPRLLNHLTMFGQTMDSNWMDWRKQKFLIDCFLSRRKRVEPGVDLFHTGQIKRAKQCTYPLCVLGKKFSFEVGDHTVLSVPFIQ